MKPIEVFAINDKMYRATLTLPYKSLEWHRCYNKCGDFTLEIPADIYDPSWRYIYTDDRPETGIIESVQLQDSGDAQKVDTIVLKGRFLEAIMNRRVFLDESVETVTYTYELDPPKAPETDITRPGLYTTNDLQEGGTMVWDRPGGTYIGDPSTGNVVAASEVKEDENGKYVEAGDRRVNVEDVPYTQEINTYYHQDPDNQDKITAVKNTGTELVETTYDVGFRDDQGNVYFYNSEIGGLQRAFGVVNSSDDNYWYYKDYYDSTGGVVTVEKTVKGPWQRTEIDDVTVPADNVAKCVSYANRFFQNGMIFEEPEFTGTTKIIDPSLQYLGDLLYSELSQEGASFRVVYDFVLNQFVFSVWKGIDRTQSQSDNPFYVFSDTWGTLYNYSVTEDESAYKNKCFVMYEYSGSDYTTSGLPDYVSTQDGKRGIITVRLEDEMSDRETYLDMRNESDALDDGESQTFMQYLEALYEKGKSYLLTECGKIKELDTGDLTMAEYMNGFDLGDKVDMLVESTGLIQEARIIEVSEVYKAEGPDIQITLGEAELKEV